MKQIILISDHVGRPLRGVAPATACETIMICPSDKPQPHARSVKFPDAWLPEFDASMDYGKRCWWVCDRIFAAAVTQLNLDADHFWCVESDVAASPKTWERLVEAGSKCELDGILTSLIERSTAPDGFPWELFSAPDWVTHQAFGPIYRLSRRALEWIADTAHTNRDAFCELNFPTVLADKKGTMCNLNDLGWFYSSQSMQPSWCAMHSGLFNHPVKTNTIGPEILKI